MKEKYLILLSFVLSSFLSFGQTKLVAPIVRNNAADTNYNTHYDSLGKGGWIALADTFVRNNLPLSVRKRGMMVSVKDSIYYGLVGGLSNSNWLRYYFGNIPIPALVGIDSITINADSSLYIAYSSGTQKFSFSTLLFPLYADYPLQNYKDSSGNKHIRCATCDAALTKLVSGGLVSYSGTGYSYDVTAARYVINGIPFTSLQGNKTLAAADPTFDRVDFIVANVLGQLDTLTGVPSANPQDPYVNPDSNLVLSRITVKAGTTTPPGVNTTVIYDELNPQTGWTYAVSSGLTVNFLNTVNPYHLTKSADVGSTWGGRGITFTSSTMLTRSNYTLFKSYINLKSTIPSGNIQVRFFNGTTAVSPLVTLSATNGFSKTVLGYQNVTIDLGTIAFTSTTFNKISITLTGTGGGLYLDYVQLQGGVQNSTPVPSGVQNFAKTVAGDSIKLTLNDGTVFTVKDSIGGASITKVDSIWRTLGQDSIKYSINGRLRSIKDSTGGSGGAQTYDLKDTSNGMIVFNVMKYGALGDGSHDDGPAIQAAITAIMKDSMHCYGIVYFPYTGKPYIIANRTVTTASNGKSVNNAQIYIPDLTPSESRVKPCGIKFLGQVAPNFQTGAAQFNYNFPLSSKGVVLESTDSLDLTGCVIGAASTTYPSYLGQNLNFTRFEIENIGIVVKSTRSGVDTASTMTGVDAYNLTQFGMSSAFVKTQTNHINSGTPAPASTSIGVRMPSVNNWGVCYLNGVWIQGFYSGIRAVEHFSSTNYLFVGACVNGLELGGAKHACVIDKLLAQGNKYNVKLNDFSYFNINLLDIEDQITGGFWWCNVYDVYQPTASLNVQGRLYYHRLRDDIVGGEDNGNFTRSPNVGLRVVTDTLYKRSVSIGGDLLGQPFDIGTIDNYNVGIKTNGSPHLIMKNTGVIVMGVAPATVTSPVSTVNVNGDFYADGYTMGDRMRVGYVGALGTYSMQIRTLSAIDPFFVQNNAGTTMLYTKSGNLNIGATTDPTGSNNLVLSAGAAPAALTSSSILWTQAQGGSGDYTTLGNSAQGKINYLTGSKIGLKSNHDLQLTSNDVVGATLLASSSNFLIGTSTDNSKLTVAGPISTAINTFGVDFTFTNAYSTVLLNVTAKTATLPTAVGCAGRKYVVKLIVSGTGTVATTSSQTIDGSTTYTLASQYKYVEVQSDGANWFVIAQN